MKPAPKKTKSLRDKLLAAALKEIKTDGAHNLSLRKVAQLAGCTPMATYRHFDSKEALIAEIAREGFEHLHSEMKTAILLHPNDALKQIEVVGQRYIHMTVQRPEHLLMMFGGFIKDHTQFKNLKDSGDSAFFSLVDLMKHCQSQKVLPKADPLKQAISAWSIVHGFAMLIINGNLEFLGVNISTFKSHADFVTKAVLHGLIHQKE